MPPGCAGRSGHPAAGGRPPQRFLVSALWLLPVMVSCTANQELLRDVLGLPKVGPAGGDDAFFVSEDGLQSTAQHTTKTYLHKTGFLTDVINYNNS